MSPDERMALIDELRRNWYGDAEADPHFLEFSRCVAAHDVRYLLIGGYAVGSHGWPRNTKDIGFWIAGDEANQARVVRALRDFAFPNAPDELVRDQSCVSAFLPIALKTFGKLAG